MSRELDLQGTGTLARLIGGFDPEVLIALWAC